MICAFDPFGHQTSGIFTLPLPFVAVSRKTLVVHSHAIEELFVTVNGPVFVPAPLLGTLPVPLQPLHKYWVVPEIIGELVTCG